MAKKSEEIEEFLKEMLKQTENNMIEIQRNILAQQFNCAPSQISYVLTTRFKDNKGYIVESRRGGGGSIKIYELKMRDDQQIDELISRSIGESITKFKAYDILDHLYSKKILTERESQIIKRTISDRALSLVPSENKNPLRAKILKESLLAVVKYNNGS
ncbi:MAG: CtsR family transcriptional regulator [Tissierellales bacterium]|jgi:transcriptional regulator CtsR|nr:CtsR family transcriptional regulator [Tissierellales bacterium]